MTPTSFSDFVGQDRVKTRLQFAVAAAKARGDVLRHVLLVGRPGLGKATLAEVIAREMSTNMRTAPAATIEKAGELAGLLTELEKGDIFFINEIDRLRSTIAHYLCAAAKRFELDIIIDQGPQARSLRLNLPLFTLIGTTQQRDDVPYELASCFPIIENLAEYTPDELTTVAHRFASAHQVALQSEALGLIAASSDGTPLDVSHRVHHVCDYMRATHVSTGTVDVTAQALALLPPTVHTQPMLNLRQGIPSHVRTEVWNRDGGKCTKCGSRERLEYDHIIPVAKGGSNTARNIELLCEACNRAKQDSIL